MSQAVNPLDGGKKTIQISPSTLSGTYISEPFQKTRRLEIAPTEWVPGGRPIYNRLPAASGRYKVEFGQDSNKAYVYLPVGNSIFGPDSLEVLASGEGKFLIIKPGSAVWKHGEVKLDPVVVSVKDLGLGNSKYTFAYQFFLDDGKYGAIYGVENYSLKGYPMGISSSTDSVKGWRFHPKYAFYGSDSVEWRNYDLAFPEHTPDAHLTWQFSSPTTFSRVEVRCPSDYATPGSASLFLATSAYGEEPNFELASTAYAETDSNGTFFAFPLDHPNPVNTWKIEWTDNKISVKDILVTGSLPISESPGEAKTRVSLVAYPYDTLPAFISDAFGNTVPAIYCALAQVEVDEDFTITSIKDLRESVNTPHQPVADWLTRPWDKCLMEMFEQVNNYSKNWMSPETCMLQEYRSFIQELHQ